MRGLTHTEVTVLLDLGPVREGFVVVVAGTVRGGDTLVLVHGSARRTVAALNTELHLCLQTLPRAPALPALP